MKPKKIKQYKNTFIIQYKYYKRGKSPQTWKFTSFCHTYFLVLFFIKIQN